MRAPNGILGGGWKSHAPQKQNMDAEIHKILMQKAGAFLARRAYSRGELKRKLAAMAEDSEIESALNRLEQLNLLNDADYAYNFALQRIRQQGWSPAKVQDALIRRQVCEAVIENVLDRIRRETPEQPVFVMEYLRKRYSRSGLPLDPKGIRDLIRHLHQRGFEDELIFAALRELIPASALQPFETGD
jgi:regulatory protein